MARFCAAIDWGMTNFRFWLLDHEGHALAYRHTSQGMSNCAEEGFVNVVSSHLQAACAPDDLPVLICGTAGSRGGWHEAPYLEIPADLNLLPQRAVRIPGQSRDTRILPGICQRDPDNPDVMRGEETQLLGAALNGLTDGLFCLPGTHSKWMELENARITRMRTFLTGDLFSIIGRHSILHYLLDPFWDDNGPLEAKAIFMRAVEKELAAPDALSGRLFNIRSGCLLDFAKPHEGKAWLSGMLIGAEAASAKALFPGFQTVNLIASGPLQKTYEAVLKRAGFKVACFDGEAMVRKGLYAAARQIWPDG